MLILFWVVVGLVGILLFRNSRYAARQYLENRQRAVFTVYVILLALLAYLVILLTSRLMETIQATRDFEATERLTELAVATVDK